MGARAHLASALALCAIFGSSSARAEPGTWSASGPGGGAVLSLAVDPSDGATLYIGLAGAGVYKSVDGGQHFSPANEGLVAATVLDLVIDHETPSIVYAAIALDSPYRSIDGGATWMALDHGVSDYANIAAVAIDPGDSAHIYLGGDDGISPVVYSTTDAGAHFVPSVSGLPPRIGARDFSPRLALDPALPLAVYFSIGGEGLYQSYDSGSTFGPVGGALPSTQVYALAVITTLPASTLLAAVGGNADSVYRSVDGGLTWKPSPATLRAPAGPLAFAADPRDSSTVYAAAGPYLYRSLDGAATFSLLSSSPEDAGDFGPLALSATGDPVLYAGSRTVLRSDDGGRTLSSVGAGLADADVRALAFDPANPGTLYAGTDDGVYRSDDSGATWSAEGAAPHGAIAALLVGGGGADRVLVATADAALWLSTDGARTFAKLQTSAAVSAFALDTTHGRVYAGGDGVLQSDDGGRSFRPVGAGATFADNPVHALAVDSGSGTVYAGAEHGLFVHSDGEEWRRADALGDEYVLALAIDPTHPTTIYAGTGILSSTGGAGVQRSMDAGAHWEEPGLGLEAMRVSSLAIDPRHPERVYAATPGGVYGSSDAAHSFALVGQGMYVPESSVVLVDPADSLHLYAATAGGGVFSVELDAIPPAGDLLLGSSDGGEEMPPPTGKACACALGARPATSSSPPLVAALALLALVLVRSRRLAQPRGHT